MKLVYYYSPGLYDDPRPGIIDGERILDIQQESNELGRVAPLLLEQVRPYLMELMGKINRSEREDHPILSLDVVDLAPPYQLASLRDFYAFEAHVKNARARRSQQVPPEWYQIPVFYFSNHHAIFGPDAMIPYPAASEALDFELEVAAIIGKLGRDIPPEEAESYIAGYTVMNDWSARDLQRQEMAVGLGPAKGKDFATSLGPWIVTPDEFRDCHSGKGYDLAMIARRNGEEIARGNWNTIHYSFAEMIAHASQNTMLYPGDVIGSGTVGGGCILELGPENAGGWLQPGDVIELEIERLGTLRNVIGERSPTQSR